MSPSFQQRVHLANRILGVQFRIGTSAGSKNHWGIARRRKSSFTSAAVDLLPDSVRRSGQNLILNEAARDDSRLWEHNPVINGDDPKGHHGNVNGINGSINESTSSHHPGGIVTPLYDPLEDLYNTRTTRYWPHLPPNVAPTADPFVLAGPELEQLSKSIRQDLIGTDHPVLNQAASYFFDASTTDGGKKVRPLMVLLLSRALADSANPEPSTTTTSTNTANAPTHFPPPPLFTDPMPWQRPDLPAAQRRLAEISEMIHTASLFHDDVIDGSDTRRGAPAVHVVFGNKMAILAGDYLLARSSIYLARLRQVEVVETMSTIIEHLVRGEVMQLRGTVSSTNNNDDSGSSSRKNERLLYYLRKNFYKTGSLMANSCKSTALLGDYPAESVDASYRFGKHVGMAFQLVDDVLDFEGSLSQLGKPALADLRAGLATAPVLLAAEECPDQLEPLIDRKFKHDGDIDRAVHLVEATSGIERTKEMARVHAEMAMDAILELNPSVHRDALVHLANKVVARTK